MQQSSLFSSMEEFSKRANYSYRDLLVMCFFFLLFSL